MATKTKAKKPGKACVDGTQAHRYALEPVDGPVIGGGCTRCGHVRTWDAVPESQFKNRRQP